MTAELRPASSLDLERLAGLFNEAYTDYFVPMRQLELVLKL